MNENTIITYENTIGKLSFAYDSAFWVTEVSGASSVDVDIGESRGAAQTGATIEGQSVQPRTITIDGAIFEPLTANRKRLLDIMAPQVTSTLTISQGGEEWYLEVVVERTPEITPGRGVQEFQARLFAGYPYWRTTASHTAQVTGIVPMFRFPFRSGGKWWVSRFSDDFYSEINNTGNVPIEFEVLFVARGAVKSPEIYHVGTGKKIRINKAMAAGEIIAVSTVYGKKGVTVTSVTGEATNGFKYLSMDSDLSMTLLPGANLLRVDAAQNREGLTVRIDAPKGVRSGV